MDHSDPMQAGCEYEFLRGLVCKRLGYVPRVCDSVDHVAEVITHVYAFQSWSLFSVMIKDTKWKFVMKLVTSTQILQHMLLVLSQKSHHVNYDLWALLEFLLFGIIFNF
jgi:hypothetical protein